MTPKHALKRTVKRQLLFRTGDGQQIVGRERRERLSQLARCGEGCFDSRNLCHKVKLLDIYVAKT